VTPKGAHTATAYRIDTGYRPSAAYKTWARYTVPVTGGNRLYIEKALLTGGYALHAGGHGG